MKLLIIGREGRFTGHSDPAELSGLDIVYADPEAGADELLSAGRDADCILADAMSAVPGEAIRNMPNLKMIHSEGVGYQYIDVKAAAEAGVYVCNCKGCNASSVAEHTVMLMLACLRDIVNGNAAVLAAEQIKKKEGHMLRGDLKEMADCVIGLVGFGDIAKETARLCAAFGAKCVYWNRSEVPEDRRFGARPATMDGLLAESDIVSLHLPVTDTTRNMAGSEFFGKMKRGSYLINTARGELVQGSALIDAIASGQLSGAGLDCVEGEPVTPDNVYLHAPEEVKRKIVFTPHIAGITASSFSRCYEMVWENLRRVQSGLEPVRVVNAPVSKK